MLKTPEKIGEIVHKVSSASPVPVTVKIRKGWDDDSINAVEVAKIIEQGGAAAIAIHGRTRAEFYSGTADWDIIKESKRIGFNSGNRQRRYKMCRGCEKND